MSGGSALLQRAASLGGAGASPPPRAAARAVLVELDPYIPDADAAPDAGPGPSAVLTPGRTYTLFVAMVPATARTDRTALVGGASEIQVRTRATGLKVTPAAQELDPGDLDGGGPPLSFDVEVAAGRPRETATLDLVVRDKVTRREQRVGGIQIHVAGDHHVPDPEFLTRCPVVLDSRPPDTIAVLHVVAAGPGELQVTGFHARTGLFRSGPVEQPDQSLVDLGKDANSKQSLAEIGEFSRKQVPELLDWLLRVLDAGGDDLALVIVEHADTHIPWEMLQIEAKGASRPLGAKITVVRWLLVQLGPRRLNLDLTSTDSRWDGGVLSHVDHVNLASTGLERDELARCAATSCATLNDVRTRLQQPLGGVGLIFLACHGVLAKDTKHGFELKDLKNPHQRIHPLDLGLLGSLEGPRPMAFLNACHSARVVRDRSGINGLPEIFLAKFAQAYLGTLGPVDDALAASIAGQFLREARSADGVHVPTFLKTLRAAAAAALELNDPDSRRRYLDTFMYVFYGTPFARLKLGSAVAAPGEESSG